MSKTIFLWGVIVCGCVCLPQPVYAASLEWEVGRESIEFAMTARLISSAPAILLPDDLMMAQGSLETDFMTMSLFQTEARKIAETQVPVLALPESGTLILLGLGLAGLASLIRKKKPSP
jgi:hypothetical protein